MRAAWKLIGALSMLFTATACGDAPVAGEESITSSSSSEPQTTSTTMSATSTKDADASEESSTSPASAPLHEPSTTLQEVTPTPSFVAGELDCQDETQSWDWSMQGSFDADATGPATAAEALSTFLAGWHTDFGGEIVYPRPSWGSLVLDGREVVTAIAGPAPAGGFLVDTSFGCQGFER